MIESGLIESFNEIKLPAKFVIVAPVSLRDETGKESQFSPDTQIQIENRSEKGILTLRINGALFVGDESRVLGKVKSGQKDAP